MGKARKLTATRTDRYFGCPSHGQGRGTPLNDDSLELREDEVWSAVHDEGARGCRPTPRSSGLSLAFDSPRNNSPQGTARQFRQEPPSGRHVAASAPLDVPDWSNVYRAESVESLPEWDDGSDDSEVVPPHEYLARSRGMGASSMFEGVGRTLKGRDLSRVRDAVWSQTGFDG